MCLSTLSISFKLLIKSSSVGLSLFSLHLYTKKFAYKRIKSEPSFVVLFRSCPKRMSVGLITKFPFHLLVWHFLFFWLLAAVYCTHIVTVSDWFSATKQSSGVHFDWRHRGTEVLWGGKHRQHQWRKHLWSQCPVTSLLWSEQAKPVQCEFLQFVF